MKSQTTTITNVKGVITMKLEQISTILNTSIVPAIMGGEYTVNPDLSNIVDLGTRISEMTADQFKTYFNDFAAAVRTYTDPRGYSPENLPLYVDSQEYGGIVQSIKSDFTETRNSNIYSLIDGQVYNDVNKYFGTAFDNKVYEKDVTFSIAKSVPNTMYKKSFMTADGVAQLVALIETWVMNTVRRECSALEHNLLATLALNGKTVNLVAEYNKTLNSRNVAQTEIRGDNGDKPSIWGEGYAVNVMSSNCIYNRHFMVWAYETISNIITAAKFANKKYNDGTVSTWQTPADAIMIFNSVFNTRGKMYNLSAPDGVTVYNTPFWNVAPANNELIPTVKNSTTVAYVDGVGGSAKNKTLTNVIGLFYDKQAVGYTTTPINPRTAYNADGDFYTTFRDFNNRYWIDTRNTAIVFTLN